ncbi:Aste57867_16890 [Aphanomyces stellatus]|uniref:Aste57867_16890 protein n=1 Tax=Aphanomyces stellatus TaxID=120398 RepID=A0A485L8D4_9STRA|nr:hypothetical protein As57867_016832 [Aphanomyces stellatus]VFT93653.1 Aste57867_16890 [Aphanomyces stellatus]
MASMSTEGELLGRYERRLSEKYRFGLHAIIDHMSCLLSVFQHAQTELGGLESLAQKKLPQMLPFLNAVHGKINLVAQATPLFLGYDHLKAYIKVLQDEKHNFDPRPQPWNALRLYDNDYQDQFASKVHVFTTLYQELDTRLPEFDAEVERFAPLLKLMSQKREDLITLLREGHTANNLPVNMKKHKADVKLAYQRSLLKYKHALQASPIKLEKQIQHEIRHFTQHMNSMLQPHWLVCHTLKRANAEIATDKDLTDRARQQIDTFVDQVLRLNDDMGEFCSVAMAKETFLNHVTSFEKAATNDWFVVCTSSLKLNFKDLLDQPLFGAYCDDLQSRMKELHTLRNSNKFQAAVALCEATRVNVTLCYHQMQQAQNFHPKVESKQEALASLKDQIQKLVVADGLVV